MPKFRGYLQQTDERTLMEIYKEHSESHCYSQHPDRMFLCMACEGGARVPIPLRYDNVPFNQAFLEIAEIVEKKGIFINSGPGHPISKNFVHHYEWWHWNQAKQFATKAGLSNIALTAPPAGNEPSANPNTLTPNNKKAKTKKGFKEILFIAGKFILLFIATITVIPMLAYLLLKKKPNRTNNSDTNVSTVTDDVKPDIQHLITPKPLIHDKPLINKSFEEEILSKVNELNVAKKTLSEVIAKTGLAWCSAETYERLVKEAEQELAKKQKIKDGISSKDIAKAINIFQAMEPTLTGWYRSVAQYDDHQTQIHTLKAELRNNLQSETLRTLLSDKIHVMPYGAEVYDELDIEISIPLESSALQNVRELFSPFFKKDSDFKIECTKFDQSIIQVSFSRTHLDTFLKGLKLSKGIDLSNSQSHPEQLAYC